MRMRAAGYRKQEIEKAAAELAGEGSSGLAEGHVDNGHCKTREWRKVAACQARRCGQSGTSCGSAGRTTCGCAHVMF